MVDSLPLSTAAIAVLGVSFSLVTYFIRSLRNRLPVPGKNVFIGGGSQGLGLATARLLVNKGANVTIVARTQSRLDAALEQLETHRVNPSQKLKAVAADLSTSEGACKAFERYTQENGIPCPDYVFAVAGGAGDILGYFKDLTPEQIQRGFELNYLSSVWQAHAACNRMVEAGIKGKIVLVSSLLGFMNFVGWAAYSPPKYALRGLADGLRNEFLLYGIDVHCYFPATIFTPGFEAENASKPDLTKKIEGADPGQSPEKCAAKLVRGLERGDFFITSDPAGDLFRTGTKGMSPSNGPMDLIWRFIAFIGIPIWRRIADHEVRTWAKKQGKNK